MSRQVPNNEYYGGGAGGWSPNGNGNGRQQNETAVRSDSFGAGTSSRIVNNVNGGGATSYVSVYGSNNLNLSSPPSSSNGQQQNNSNFIAIGGGRVVDPAAAAAAAASGFKLRPGHKEALIQIKRSLLPFDNMRELTSSNSNNAVGNTDTLSSESSSGTTGSADLINQHETSMLESLVHMGFDKDSAWYALKLTQFRSLSLAVDILLKTNNPNVFRPPTSSDDNRISHVSLDQRRPSFDNADSNSSRSESPMPPRIPTPQGRSNQGPVVYANPNLPSGYSTPAPNVVVVGASATNQQRTPSPMAKTGLANAGAFVVPAPLLASTSYQQPQQQIVESSSSSTYLTKKSHMSVNLASYPTTFVVGDSISPAHLSSSSQQSTSYFVRQNFAPATAQTAFSRKVEKPLPQNAVSPFVAPLKQNGDINEPLDRRQSTKVISARLDPNSLSSVRIAVQPASTASSESAKSYRLEANTNNGHVLSVEARGNDYSTRNNAKSANNYSPQTPVVNGGGGPSTSNQQRINSTAAVAGDVDARYLEHLFQRVDNVLTVRSGDGSPVPMNSYVGGSLLRKRDSAASSSSDTSTTIEHQPPIVAPAALKSYFAAHSSQPTALITGGSPFAASEPFMRDGASPSSSVSTEGSDGGARGDAGCMVVRCESPLPEVIRQQLTNARYSGTPFKSCLKPCTPHAFKFFMEQHTDNIMKQYNERQERLEKFEKEMQKGNFAPELKCEMRKLLRAKESLYLRFKRQKMDTSMFKTIATIGVGAFGEVTLVKKNDTKKLYAMKTLRKSDVMKRNQVAHVKAERDILSEADSEWVVKLYYSFQDKDNLFFIMEYIPGGDMMALLIKKGIFEEPLAKFYIAELVCAIESVHKLGFIHRDIKPDNILIDHNGHIKLTDFGLCTGLRWTHDWKRYAGEPSIPGHVHQDSFDLLQMREPNTDHKLLDYRHQKQRYKAHSLVGTPNYIAPEVLQRTGHTKLCDWWSVGVILYEMVVGHPPFGANTPEETQLKVINYKRTLMIPTNQGLSLQVINLIQRLCCSAEERLGREQGAVDIKQHRFFANVDWDNLRSMKAPYRPEILHETDTSNFETVEPRPDPPPEERGAAGSLPDHAFYEFTFRRFFDSDGHGCPTIKEQAPYQRPQLEPVFERYATASSSNHLASSSGNNYNNATAYEDEEFEDDECDGAVISEVSSVVSSLSYQRHHVNPNNAVSSSSLHKSNSYDVVRTAANNFAPMYPQPLSNNSQYPQSPRMSNSNHEVFSNVNILRINMDDGYDNEQYRPQPHRLVGSASTSALVAATDERHSRLVDDRERRRRSRSTRSRSGVESSVDGDDQNETSDSAVYV